MKPERLPSDIADEIEDTCIRLGYDDYELDKEKVISLIQRHADQAFNEGVEMAQDSCRQLMKGLTARDERVALTLAIDRMTSLKRNGQEVE